MFIPLPKIKLNKLRSHIDRVRYTIYLHKDKDYYKLDKMMQEKFGDPKSSKFRDKPVGRFGKRYGDTKVWLSMPIKKWSWIDYYPEEYGLTRLLNILEEFPNSFVYGNKKQNIKQIEVAFYLEINGISQSTAEDIARQISLYLVPNYPK